MNVSCLSNPVPVKKILVTAALPLMFLSGAAFASAPATPIDQLETEVAKLSDTYDVVVPVAVGAAVFSVGMILIKRVAFS